MQSEIEILVLLLRQLECCDCNQKSCFFFKHTHFGKNGLTFVYSQSQSLTPRMTHVCMILQANMELLHNFRKVPQLAILQQYKICNQAIQNYKS